MFDLILSEYAGYTDDSLLDVTMDRIRQMAEVITERRKRTTENDVRQLAVVAQVHATALGAVLGGLAPTKEAAKGIRKVVQSFDFLKFLGLAEKKKAIPSTDSVMRAFGVRPDGHVGKR